MKAETFDFNKYFNTYENNPTYQEQIIDILKSNEPRLRYRWVEDKEQQERGIDLILYRDLKEVYIDIKAVSHRHVKYYLQNIPVELVSNSRKFLNSNGKKGKSWLYKVNSDTHYLLYYWIGENDEIKDSLIQISYSTLRKFVEAYFSLNTLYKTLNISPKLKKPRKKARTLYIGTLNNFKLYGAKNRGYYTINTPIDLSFLRKEFSRKFGEKIHKIIRQEPKSYTNTKKQKMSRFF